MSDVAIRVEGLGKSYLIGHETEHERYTALRDVVSGGVKRWATGLRRRLAGSQIAAGMAVEEFWALNDVSFDIQQGEVVGIIGRNGAGKSTLLKILSRITEPSKGRVTIKGRVASLLEVGTGFHPELTGRENVFLNGAILGMTRREITRKFDEIVAFAGVEKFIDTPVKRYSSGMYVRLAFAVAAHLEPEMLVVDEVLAVGDAEFQKRCIGKMHDVARNGRTVIFVSHNMGAVQSLCSTALLLEGGKLRHLGPVAECIEQYSTPTFESAFRASPGSRPISVIGVSDVKVNVEENGTIILRTRISLICSEATPVNIDIRVKSQLGSPIIFGTMGNDKLLTPVKLKVGENSVVVELDITGLVVGGYTISVDISKPFVEWYDRIEDACAFTVDEIHWRSVVQPTRQSWGVGDVQRRLRLAEERGIAE